MKVALRDTYVEYVLFCGMSETYPRWFNELIDDTISLDESRYTLYVHYNERTMSYYDKQLVDDYSVFVRKPDGEVYVTDWDAFNEVYQTFTWSEFSHSGISAPHENCIEYVECKAGVLRDLYPAWFYEYFTEAFNFPQDDKTFFFYDTDKHNVTATRDSLEITAGGGVTVKEDSVFLRNRLGEIKGMTWVDFLKYYDPYPELGEDSRCD